MTTETNLAGERPSERSATGPFLVRWTSRVHGPAGLGLETEGAIEGRSGSPLETAVAIVLLLAAAVLLPAAGGAILLAAGLTGWPVGAFICGSGAVCVPPAVVVIVRRLRR